MKISQKGVDLIKQFEGCRLTAYKCPAGVWTIGYGHTGDVKPGQTITSDYAETLLRNDLVKYELKVSKYETRYGWNQNEFDAMVSFAYNVGNIDQLTDRGNRSRAVIAEKILQYNKAAGKVLPGLTRRRQMERDLFLQNARTTLKKGSRGVDVTYLQQQLTDLGYGVGAIDGIFGVKTLEAVKAFQADRGLSVDGIVGAKTWAALE